MTAFHLAMLAALAWQPVCLGRTIVSEQFF